MGQNEDKKRTIDARIERLRERYRKGASLEVIMLAILDLLADELR